MAGGGDPLVRALVRHQPRDPAQRAGTIARAAERLVELPLLHAPFAEGTVCAAYRDRDRDESPEAEEARHLKRGLTSTRMDEGLVRIVAVLEPDEAAIVLAAIDRRVEDNWRRDRDAEDDVPRTELSERRATALVELATDGLVTGPDPIVRGEHIDVRVNADLDVITGARDDGLCEIEGIGAVAPALVRRLLCDARVCTAREQIDGIFNLGRSQRTPNRQQRRSLHRRDGGCRYPGCRMRRYVDAHHVVPWDDDGPTDIDNLMLLCREHHRLFHEGAYRITVHGGGRFTFYRPDGRPVVRPPCRARPGTASSASGSPRATDGGGRYDLDLTIDALQYRAPQS